MAHQLLPQGESVLTKCPRVNCHPDNFPVFDQLVHLAPKWTLSSPMVYHPAEDAGVIGLSLTALLLRSSRCVVTWCLDLWFSSFLGLLSILHFSRSGRHPLWRIALISWRFSTRNFLSPMPASCSASAIVAGVATCTLNHIVLNRLRVCGVFTFHPDHELQYLLFCSWSGCTIPPPSYTTTAPVIRFEFCFSFRVPRFNLILIILKS